MRARSLRAWNRWRTRGTELRADTYALFLACKDSRVPWLPKLIATLVVAYALSPIDLIPDFIPIFGYLDDLILLPLGILLVVRMLPPPILEEHRAEAALILSAPHPSSRLGAVIVLSVWALGVGWFIHIGWRLYRE